MQTTRSSVDLSPFNTLALPARAMRYQRITEAAQLTAPGVAGEKRFVLGGGSNLVLTGDIHIEQVQASL